MATKLTLRLDEKVIREAKRFARSRKTSLSRVVADYFKVISAGERPEGIESPILGELAGIIAPRGDVTALGKEYRKHLERKYL